MPLSLDIWTKKSSACFSWRSAVSFDVDVSFIVDQTLLILDNLYWSTILSFVYVFVQILYRICPANKFNANVTLKFFPIEAFYATTWRLSHVTQWFLESFRWTGRYSENYFFSFDPICGHDDGDTLVFHKLNHIALEKPNRHYNFPFLWHLVLTK